MEEEEEYHVWSYNFNWNIARSGVAAGTLIGDALNTQQSRVGGGVDSRLMGAIGQQIMKQQSTIRNKSTAYFNRSLVARKKYAMSACFIHKPKDNQVTEENEEDFVENQFVSLIFECGEYKDERFIY